MSGKLGKSKKRQEDQLAYCYCDSTIGLSVYSVRESIELTCIRSVCRPLFSAKYPLSNCFARIVEDVASVCRLVICGDCSEGLLVWDVTRSFHAQCAVEATMSEICGHSEYLGVSRLGHKENVNKTSRTSTQQ